MLPQWLQYGDEVCTVAAPLSGRFANPAESGVRTSNRKYPVFPAIHRDKRHFETPPGKERAVK
jgi:hypothetical protein